MSVQVRMVALTLLIGLAFGSSAECSAVRNNPAPAIPDGDPAAWVTSADVPADLRDFRGKTRFMLWVGDDGRVTDCVIKGSSGSAKLDNLACSILTKRARFVAATDPDGNKVPCPWSSSINWNGL